MDLFDAIRERRSVHRYDPSHRLSEEEIRGLMELVILSPTSFNIQNWRFVVVTDPELRQELRAAAWNQAQVSEASMVVVICGDRLAAEREPERYYSEVAEEKRRRIVPTVVKAYQGKEQLQRDEIMRSGGIAAQTLMLAAKGMGLDTCAMVGFDFAKVAELIHLPQDHEICMMVTVGKALQPARPRSGQLPLDEVMLWDRFQAGAAPG